MVVVQAAHPVPVLYFPGLQEAQASPTPALYWPDGQAVQRVPCIGFSVPGGHAEQIVSYPTIASELHPATRRWFAGQAPVHVVHVPVWVLVLGTHLVDGKVLAVQVLQTKGAWVGFKVLVVGVVVVIVGESVLTHTSELGLSGSTARTLPGAHF